MSPVMLGTMSKAQRTGSKVPLRDRDKELKLTGGFRAGLTPAPEGPLSVCLSDSPPGSEHHSFLILRAQGPGPRAVPLQPLPCPYVPWASLGKAFSRAGVSKEHS